MAEAKKPRRIPATNRAARAAAAFLSGAALITALPATAQSSDPTAASDAAADPNWPNYGPAQEWRFLKGPGVDGALRLSPEASQANDHPIGHLVLMIVGDGFYQGIYNLREGGESAIGVFWRDGEPTGGEIDGVIDIGHAPVGDPLGPTQARITFISGEIIEGAQAE